jgi:hypothetical protein
MKIEKPKNLDPKIYFKQLIEKVKEDNLETALENSLEISVDYGALVSSEKETFAYAEGKWNIKQLFQHLTDCERIMAYRALSIARGEKGRLLGFDDQGYVDQDNSNNRSLRTIIEDFRIARSGTISLMKSLSAESLDFEGDSNGINATSRTVFWFIAAHNFHHMEILKERYLK